MERGEVTAEQRATAGVFIQVDSEGQLIIRRGYVATTATKSAAPAKTAATADPGLNGWGHTGLWHMTHIATAAVRHALLKDPLAALDVLVASLAWDLVSRTGGGAIKLDPRGVDPRSIPAEAKLPGEAAWEERRRYWCERLPAEDFQACFDMVLGLPADDRAEIVALSIGLALDAVETRFDQPHRAAWEQLAIIGRHAEVDVASAWIPDESFLGRGSKAALLAALTETGGADAFAKAKKSEMVATLAKRVGDRKWTPELLSGFTPPKGTATGAIAAE